MRKLVVCRSASSWPSPLPPPPRPGAEAGAEGRRRFRQRRAGAAAARSRSPPRWPGIQAPALAAHIAFLAAPALEGRGLGSRGLDAAAEYVAATLALAGDPAARGGRRKQPPPRPTSSRCRCARSAALAGEVTVERRQRRGGPTPLVPLRAWTACSPRSPPQSARGAGRVRGLRDPRGEARPRRLRGARRARQDRARARAALPAGAEWQKPELVARYGADEGARALGREAGDGAGAGRGRRAGGRGRATSRRGPRRRSRPQARFFLPFEAARPPRRRSCACRRLSADALLAAAA